MFLFRKKDINEKSIKKYKSALRAIKIYISLRMYEKAVKACDEVLIKEKDSLANLVRKLQNQKFGEKEIKKETIIFEHRKNDIEKLKEKATILSRKKTEKEIQKKFKKKFLELRKEIKNKIKLGKSLEAMSELKYFLEENRNRVEVVNFYNKEKKVIKKAMEKQQENLKKQLKNDTKAEAMNLVGLEYEKKEEKTEKGISLLKKIFSSIFKIDKLKKRIQEEKLIDEVNKLIEEDDKRKNDLVKGKIENIHKGLVKELKYEKLVGYDIYGKILGADKISGDAFGIDEKKERYTLFLGDATGHGIRAGFIITLLNKGFRKFRDKSLKEMVFEINNSLKQNLESRNFITGAFFDIEKNSHKISYVGMGHEPIIFYNKEKRIAEKKILGGLAAGIRIMKNTENAKVKELEMNDGDIFIIFSDGIVEAKNDDGEYYGIDRLIKNFNLVAKDKENLQEIYKYLIEDVKLFRGGSRFDDDASILLIRRDKTKDLVEKDDNFIEDLKQKENLNRNEAKKLEGKTKDEIKEELDKIRKKRNIERIVGILKNSYNNGEILKLKQDAVRYVKEGYVDKRINFYLKKALENEKSYKIDQKNQKMINKYKVLEELLKKGNFDAVIKESEDIIAKDGGF